jgi:hypothetical protein
MMNEMIASQMQPQPMQNGLGMPAGPGMAPGMDQGGQMPPELMQLVQILSQFPPEALQMLMQLAMGGQQQQEPQYGPMGGAMDELVGVEMQDLSRGGQPFAGEQVDDVVALMEAGKESPLQGLLGPGGRLGAR